MDINNILESKELKKLLDDSIGKTFYRFKMRCCIEYDDFSQECYMFVIDKIHLFDETKSSLNTYIPLLVMTCAKAIICEVNGYSKTESKLRFNNEMIRLDFKYENNGSETECGEIFGNNLDNDLKLVINEIIGMSNLSLKEKNILLLMYKGYRHSEISRMIGTTRGDIHKTFKKTKKKVIQKYGEIDII